MGEKVTNLIKEKTIKVNPMHRHFTHAKSYIIAFTHCIRYIFSYLKQECRVKKGLAPNKSFRKTFRKKEDKQIGAFKEFRITTKLASEV